MGRNVTARSVGGLVRDGGALCGGLRGYGAAIGMEFITEAKARAGLEALVEAEAGWNQALGEEAAASKGAQAADEANWRFIERFTGWMGIFFGVRWNAQWVATGLPGRAVSVPRKLASRAAAMLDIAGFLEANPKYELLHEEVSLTAGVARGLYADYHAARSAANAAWGRRKAALRERDAAFRAFRKIFGSAVSELSMLLGGDDPRWLAFGLAVPDAPERPDAPRKVSVEALGGGRALVRCSWPRRASSLNYYRRIAGADAEPVKVENRRGKELLIENLPAGATVEVTITGVNDAGEGRACEAVGVVVV